MSAQPSDETLDSEASRVVLHRVDGPVAREIFLHGRPTSEAGASEQADAVYRAVARALEAEGGDAASLVSETVLLRDAEADVGAVREARRRVLVARDGGRAQGVVSELGQPPCDESSRVEVLAHAVLPHEGALRGESLGADPTCATSPGLRLQLGEETRFHTGPLYGAGPDAHAQTRSMFEAAEALLAQAGLGFGDVVRTWIHLREMDRDYPALNEARRAFFASRGVAPVPASTGIGASLVSEGHDLALAVYAVRGHDGPRRAVMTSPTLNDAVDYGADFARGMRVHEANKVALQVSGTASIDGSGRTAHVGDVEAQAERMLVNVAGLLEGQGAGFGDVVSAITYVKDRRDAERVRAKLREAGFGGFPHAVVEARICRPELLVETEALAVLPA